MTLSTKSNFGEVLKGFRLAAAMSQETLAERAGVSVESVGTLERGKYTSPRLRTVSLLADALDLSLEQRAALLAAARPSSKSQSIQAVNSVVPSVRPAADVVVGARGLGPAPTPLLGRERDEAAVVHLLRQDRVRLLTLIGPGGVGKTRLAMQVASGLRDAFPDGVYFVGLAPLRDPELVLATIAQSLGLRETDGVSLAEMLTAHVGPRNLLLVLDNVEHLLAAAPDLASLLAQCPGLRVLATSRAPLRLRGEQEYVLHPLPTPPHGQQLPFDELAGCAAVQLFVQRAQAVQPEFTLSEENAEDVGAICRRLDGLPLALELAVPHLTLFTPAQLLARLTRRLKMLTGGARDLPIRQQTLRATLDWSHELLSKESQILFAPLGVFEGGASMTAIEAVCDPDGILDVLPPVRALLEHSLLLRFLSAEEPRLGMLETVREYACERLAELEEATSLRRAHAMYYLALAEIASVHLRGTEQAAWLHRLEAERDNLRTAFTWSLEAGEIGVALRLGTALEGFWSVRGYLSEGRAWLEEALSRPSSDHLEDRSAGSVMRGIRAKALAAAAALTIEQGDYARAADHYDESLGLCRRADNGFGYAMALNGLGFVAQLEGNHGRATELYEESLLIMRALDDRAGMARAVNNLGLVAQLQGRYDEAVALHKESMALKQELGHERGIAVSLHNLGEVALLQGDLAGAASRFTESMVRRQRLGTSEGVAASLDGLAAVVGASGRQELAARLLGAAARLRSLLGAPPKIAVRPLYEPTVASVRATLGNDAFAEAWRLGGQLPLAEIIAEAQQICAHSGAGS